MSLENKDSFERRLQSIIQAVILALVLWVGYSIIGLRESSIEMRGQIIQATRENAELRSEIVLLKREISDLKSQIVAATIAAVTTNATTAAAAAAAANRRKPQ